MSTEVKDVFELPATDTRAIKYTKQFYEFIEFYDNHLVFTGKVDGMLYDTEDENSTDPWYTKPIREHNWNWKIACRYSAITEIKREWSMFHGCWAVEIRGNSGTLQAFFLPERKSAEELYDKILRNTFLQQ